MPDFYRNKNLRYSLIAFLSLLPVLLHLYTNLFAGYGYFRDELYYLACSGRPDSGYVDHPPLSVLILYLLRMAAGDSLFSLRFIPAVCSGLTVLTASLLTLRLGGKTFALILTSFAVMFTPVFLAMNSYYSMNSFDILLWTIAFYIIALIVSENKLTYWLILGVVFGAGLLNKISFIWLETGFFTGLLISGKRKEFLTVRPYLTAVISIIIFSPFIVWNVFNDYAHIEFIRNATSQKYSHITVLDFLSGQLMMINPVSLIIAFTGIYYLLFHAEGRKFSILCIIFLVTLLILIINGHSKAEYLAPAYTALFSAGSVFTEKKTIVRNRWIRYALLIPLFITGILTVPLAIPLLPVESYLSYSDNLGMKPTTSEDKELSGLPQFFADMHGWEKMAENVSSVYMTMPKEERLRTVVFGRNYGEAAAMEFYRKKYPIPRTVSSHNSYWLWGFPDIQDPVIIIIGGDKNELLKTFDSVEVALIHSAEYSMPYENNIPVFIARNFKTPAAEVWKNAKNYE